MILPWALGFAHVQPMRICREAIRALPGKAVKLCVSLLEDNRLKVSRTKAKARYLRQ